MARLGLIEAHELRIGEGKRSQFPFGIMPLMGDALPTRIIRYTLPDKTPPLQVRRARENAERMSNAWRSLSELPEEVETLEEVERLHAWLEDVYQNRKQISPEQNELLRKLAAAAATVLRDRGLEIQKFYVAAAVRSNLEPEAKQETP